MHAQHGSIRLCVLVQPCMLCCCWVAGECSSSSSFGSLNGTLSALQPAGHSVPLEVSYVPPAPVVQTVGSTSSIMLEA
jgi:hypothetical protein